MARGLLAELGSAARRARADVLIETASLARTSVLALSGKLSRSHRDRCVSCDCAESVDNPRTVDAEARERGMGRVAQSWLGILALRTSFDKLEFLLLALLTA